MTTTTTFTPTDHYDLSTEWHEAKNATAKGRGPRGWKTWQIKRAFRDGRISDSIDHDHADPWYAVARIEAGEAVTC